DGADNMIDAKNLKKLRKRARLTQPQLAAKVGVSPSTVFRWEKGKNIPHPERLKKLNRIFSHLLEDN
ncbi:unnamed protein product, partial [marine sediment metagenome]